jgi:hypothetical protein
VPSFAYCHWRSLFAAAAMALFFTSAATAAPPAEELKERDGIDPGQIPDDAASKKTSTH